MSAAPRPKRCPKCGAPLDPGVAGGVCLACLLGLGLKHDREQVTGLDAESPESSGDHPEIVAGRYRILEKIGEGGCGVVYRAQQLEPVRREVALKIIKLGMDTQSVVARFDAERQALAMMDHPGIAKVFDGGATATGRPYFVMDLVSGEPITDYCERRQLPLEQRLRLFVELCQAVQHAHQKGVIHRDIKPSNVLVIEEGGAPHPRIIDFGVAKATARQRLGDETIYTAFDQFVGTPAYMSPEQAGLTAEDVDTRSDIYSLGVLLYQLLTGVPPFDPRRLRDAALDELCRIIRDEEPAAPSTRLSTLAGARGKNIPGGLSTDPARWARRLRGDLDWVVLKAIEKERTRRYSTAQEFAQDIERHLNSEPVTARPPGVVYRLQKMARRNKAAFIAAALVMAALLAALVVSTWRFHKEQEARRTAAAQAARSDQVARFLEEMIASAGPSVALGRDTTLLREVLDRAAERLGSGLHDHPEVEAELRTVIGTAYRDIGQWDHAEAMHREALRLREAQFGPHHKDVMDSLNRLVAVLNHRAGTGDLAEAEILARRVLEFHLSRGGDNHPEVATARIHLGWNLTGQSRFVEAEAEYRAALDIFIRHNLGETPAAANVLHSLASVLAISDRNRLGEAEALVREALDLLRQIHDGEHPAIADALDSLGLILRQRHDFTGAEAVLREGLESSRKLQGNDHPMVADIAEHLARVLLMLGKPAEAEAALRDAIDIYTNRYGSDHPAFRERFSELATRILFAQGKVAEAEAAALEWVRLWRAAGARDDRMLAALHWQGIILGAGGRWQEAEPVLRECLALCEELGSGPRPISRAFCANIRRDLAYALLRQDKPAEAEPLRIEDREIPQQDADGEDDLNSLETTIHYLMEIYDITGRPAEAAKWRQRLEQ